MTYTPDKGRRTQSGQVINSYVTLEYGAIDNLSLKFNGDSDTGFYHNAVGSIGFVSEGNIVLRLVGQTSNVNYLDITSSDTGNPTTIEANGADTDIDIQLSPKGMGLLLVPSGFDMSNGPDNAIATKAYVDYNNPWNRTEITSNYTIQNNDVYIACRHSTTITVTLPLGEEGKKVIIKDELGESNSYPITVDCQLSDTIDSSEDIIIQTRFAAIQFVYSGSEWRII